jgi:GT2 family glycosyltransferase
MLGDACRRIAGAAGDPRYASWFEEHRVTVDELRAQVLASSQLAEDERPLVSLVMPVFRTHGPFLEAAISSVLCQSYDRWELVVVNASCKCKEVDDVLDAVTDERVRVIEVENRSISENTNAGIDQASGDYVAFMDHDDVLEPDALWCYVSAVRSRPSVDLLYCDEDRMDGDRLHTPAFKTFPNYGKLYTHNYVTHLLMVSRYVLEHTERSGPEVAGAQDYDLTLKAFEVARGIAHVPRVLYHWREHEGSTAGGSDQKPYAHEAGCRALEGHLARRGIAATVDDGPLHYTYHVRYDLPDPLPKVSVVIPTRDHADLLRTCVDSVLGRSTYPDLEVVLVENDSEEAATFALYDELRSRDDRVRVVVWSPPEPGEFNYSAIVNHGVRHSGGAFVVLLNNDTEVIEPDWIQEMLGCFARPEIGVVGARLLFGDGLVQHVGMVANPAGDFCHVCQNVEGGAMGPAYAVAMPGDYAMVTGACQMVQRSVFDELGGYDERLAVGFNDGDLCLRARELGYEVTVAEHATLYHREFSSRGRETTDRRLRARYLAEKGRMLVRHAAFFAEGDPAVNPNLDGFGTYFELPQP